MNISIKGSQKKMESTFGSKLRFRQPTPDTKSGNNSPKSVHEVPPASKPFLHTKLSGNRKRFVLVDEDFASDTELLGQVKFSNFFLQKAVQLNVMVLFGMNRYIPRKATSALMCIILVLLFKNLSSKNYTFLDRIEIFEATRLIFPKSEMQNFTEQMSRRQQVKTNDNPHPPNVTYGEDFTPFTKPYRSVSYHDIDFKMYSIGAPSCEEHVNHEDISFTLVTQVSEDRLWLITQNCVRWAPGRISVAVFTNKSIDTLWDDFSKLEAKYGSCQPNQVTLSALSTINYGKGNYPINTLRNLALQQVKTTHIMYVDSDFFVSPNLFSVLHHSDIKKRLAKDYKLALVVPAFQIRQKCKKTLSEYDCRLDNMKRIPKDVDELLPTVISHKTSAFDPTNRGGHGSTSYIEWARMNPGDLRDIPCILSNRYEPYLAVRYCKDYPPYQEIFTGYGKNKMTQIMQMRHTGYLFAQVGGVFLCHYPHPEAASRESWKEGDVVRNLWIRNRTAAEESYGPIDWTKFKRGQVDKIYIEFKKWLRAEVPDTARTPIASEPYEDDVKLWLNDEDAPLGQRELLQHPLPDRKVCNKVVTLTK